MLHLHKWKLLFLAFMAQFSLIISLSIAEPKYWGQINWLDITSEGGVALLALTWLLLILQSRPEGRVTIWLSLGLGLIFLAQFQDLLDEFIAFPASNHWDNWIESGFMLPGLGLLTAGIYLWHQEQLALNKQLRKRERLFREHRSLDKVTNLSRIDYFYRQLDAELRTHQQHQAPLSLLLLDVDHFDLFNRRHGHQDGDRFLLALSELLLLNLRDTDLLCRYAGDRFAVILPFTHISQAEIIAQELTNAAKHFAFKCNGASTTNSISIGCTQAKEESAAELVKRTNHALLQAKQTTSVYYRAAS